MSQDTHHGKFSALVYYETAQFPVEVELDYTEEEAQSIEQAKVEHHTEEDWPDLFDLAPSLAIKLRAAFIEECPEEFQYNAEMLDFDFLTLP